MSNKKNLTTITMSAAALTAAALTGQTVINQTVHADTVDHSSELTNAKKNQTAAHDNEAAKALPYQTLIRKLQMPSQI